jgi:hypothetical protein
MKRNLFGRSLPLKVLVGVLALLAYAPPSSAIAGVRRRAVRRTAIVVGSEEKGAAEKQEAAAQQQAAAAQSAAAQQTAAASQAAAASAAAASQAAAAASQAAAHPATPQKSPQQQLEELQTLYKSGLISESDYNAAKAKILASLSQ